MQKVEIPTELHKSLNHNWLMPGAGFGRVTGRKWTTILDCTDTWCGRVSWW